MPYIKPREKPFEKVSKLLRGEKITGPKLGEILGCSHVTGKKKLENPEFLTLGDLGKICTLGHIPIEKIREAIVR